MIQIKFDKSVTVCFYAALLLLVLIVSGGCGGGKKAHMRFGAFFGSPAGMKFYDAQDLGTPHFRFSIKEKNGMVYTCKGGFIDTGHLREAADRTAYFSEITYRNLVDKKSEFSFHLIEPSLYSVKVSYPSNWGEISTQDREKIAGEVSILLSQYFAHTSMVWHEIMTWYGYATLKVFPDTISAFSCEDGYSDLLGTRLGAEALRDKKQRYNDAMTELIYKELRELDAQPAEVGKQAAEKVKGKWYTGGLYFFVDMKKHNFDIGLDDGSITPVLVPGICPDVVPKLYAVPDLKQVEQYGFRVEVEIEPRVFKKKKIYESIGLDKESRIKPEVHFPLIMANIEKQTK